MNLNEFFYVTKHTEINTGCIKKHSPRFEYKFKRTKT